MREFDSRRIPDSLLLERCEMSAGRYHYLSGWFAMAQPGLRPRTNFKFSTKVHAGLSVRVLLPFIKVAPPGALALREPPSFSLAGCSAASGASAGGRSGLA
jgi:hypothetical protein